MPSKDYWPEKFSVSDIEEAKDLILTAQGGLTSDERWTRETLPQVELLREQFHITEQSVLLDFGAGIGRVAKELIEQTGCCVIGVDISAKMRTLGHAYCDSPNYLACSVKGLKSLLSNGLRADFAYSVWVLQHSVDPWGDMRLLFDSLADGGGLYVLNLTYSVLPIEDGWNFEALDLRPLLEEQSTEFRYPDPPDGLIVEALKEDAFSGFYWK